MLEELISQQLATLLPSLRMVYVLSLREHLDLLTPVQLVSEMIVLCLFRQIITIQLIRGRPVGSLKDLTLLEVQSYLMAVRQHSLSTLEHN